MKTEWDEIEGNVLRRRAVELAKPLDDQNKTVEVIPLLEFTLMAKSHAIALEKIEAVTRIGDIVSIPLTPQHISGIVRRGGKSFTLVSLRHFFNKRAEGLADADFAVIVNAGNKQIAVQVEDIQGVIHVAKNDLIPPPDNFDPEQAPYVSSVTTSGLVLLDLDKLIEAPGFGMDAKK